jgi:hypothetical protein
MIGALPLPGFLSGGKPAPVALGRVKAPVALGRVLLPVALGRVPVPVASRATALAQPQAAVLTAAVSPPFSAIVARPSSPAIVPGAALVVPVGLTGGPAVPDDAAPVPYDAGRSWQVEYSPPTTAIVTPSSLVTDRQEAPAIVASTFGAHVEAPDYVWIAGGAVALGLLGWFLHRKGFF